MQKVVFVPSLLTVSLYHCEVCLAMSYNWAVKCFVAVVYLITGLKLASECCLVPKCTHYSLITYQTRSFIGRSLQMLSNLKALKVYQTDKQTERQRDKNKVSPNKSDIWFNWNTVPIKFQNFQKIYIWSPTLTPKEFETIQINIIFSWAAKPIRKMPERRFDSKAIRYSQIF